MMDLSVFLIMGMAVFLTFVATADAAMSIFLVLASCVYMQDIFKGRICMNEGASQ